MSWCKLVPVLLVLCGSTVASGQAAAPSTAPATRPVLKAGFAERDVSPDLGMEQPGNYMKAFHRIKHDLCKVRASVFEEGGVRVAVVGLDALMIRRPQVLAARKLVAGRTGIKPENVLIAASHTHAGGPTGMVLPGEYDDAPESLRKLAYEQSSCADAKYLERLVPLIAEAVVEADGKLAPVRAAAGYGLEEKAIFNRRFKMRNGLTFTHPGQGNPDIVEPAGPVDGQVGVLGAWDDKGRLVGCVVNYACHATTGPGGTSADYVYYVERSIRGLFGDDVVVVFLAGMAGDVTQVDNRAPTALKQSGEAMSRYVGGRVGAEACKALVALERSAGPLSPVRAESRVLKLNRRPPAAERVERAKKMVEGKPGKDLPLADWVFAKETLMVDHLAKCEPAVDVEVMAVQVGPLVCLSCPAEYFTKYGLELKAASGFPVTFPVSLANDCVGYVPSREAFGPGGGGYETRLTSYSNLEVTAGDRIRDGLLAIAKGLKPGEVPVAPPAPPFKAQPWGYGSVPPEVE